MNFCFCADSIKGTLQKGTEFSFFVSTQGIPPTHPTLSPSHLGLYLTPPSTSLTSPLLGLCLPSYIHRPADPKWRRRKEGGGEMRRREDASGGRRRDEVHGSTTQSRVTRQDHHTHPSRASNNLGKKNVYLIFSFHWSISNSFHLFSKANDISDIF